MAGIQNVRFCRVISVNDDTDSDLIKARISPEDDGIPEEKIPYAFPLLPKMLHIKPKPGEAVLVLLAVSDNSMSQRYYVGPIISQDDKLWYDDYEYSTTFMRGTEYKPTVAPSTQKDNNGIVPNNNDVYLRGRKNADVQVTENDVRVKSGVKLTDESNHYSMRFNEQDPAFVKVKYHPDGLITEEDRKNYNSKNGDELKQVNSTVSIVGDKINLLSTQSTELPITPIDRDELINDDTIKNALKEAYKLPYGEKLVDILLVFINAFLKHTHPFSMLPPSKSNGIPELNEKKATLLDKKELLSDTVRIN